MAFKHGHLGLVERYYDEHARDEWERLERFSPLKNIREASTRLDLNGPIVLVEVALPVFLLVFGEPDPSPAGLGDELQHLEFVKKSPLQQVFTTSAVSSPL